MICQTTDRKEFCLIPLAKDFLLPKSFLLNGRSDIQCHTLLVLGEHEPRVHEAIDAMFQVFCRFFDKPLSYLFQHRREIGDPAQCDLPFVNAEQRKLVADIVSGEHGTSMWRYELIRDGITVGELYGIRRDTDPEIHHLLRVVPGTDLEFAQADFAKLKQMTVDLASSETGRSYSWLWPTSPELAYQFCAWLEAAGEQWPPNLNPVN